MSTDNCKQVPFSALNLMSPNGSFQATYERVPNGVSGPAVMRDTAECGCRLPLRVLSSLFGTS